MVWWFSAGFAESDAVEAVIPQQLGAPLDHISRDAVFNLAQIKVGIGKIAAGEAAFFILLVDEVASFVSNHDFAAGLGDAQHFVDGFLFCNCLISSSAIKIFSYLFFIFCFPFLLFFCKEKTVTLFLIYCFRVSPFLNFNYLSHL